MSFFSSINSLKLKDIHMKQRKQANHLIGETADSNFLIFLLNNGLND